MPQTLAGLIKVNISLHVAKGRLNRAVPRGSGDWGHARAMAWTECTGRD